MINKIKKEFNAVVLLVVSFLMLGLMGCFQDNNSVQSSTSLKSKKALNKSTLSAKKENIVIIKFKDGTAEHRKDELRKSIGATKIPESRPLPFEKWEVTSISIEEAIKLLEKSPEIDYVEPNFKYDLLQKKIK